MQIIYNEVFYPQRSSQEGQEHIVTRLLIISKLISFDKFLCEYGLK